MMEVVDEVDGREGVWAEVAAVTAGEASPIF